MKTRCLYCNCDRLMAPREPVGIGSVVICGACCGLMVVDVNETGAAGPTGIVGASFIRSPTIDERRAALKDDQVKRAIDEYNKILFTKNKSKGHRS